MSKRKQSTPPGSPRPCLFCERIANSPEHLWSDWMAPYFKRTPHDQSQEVWHRIGPGGAHPPSAKVFHGHPTNRKLRFVCRACNNHWMSKLEVEAKEFIEPMIHGRRVVLEPAARKTVAAWITLKMMIYEHTDPRAVVFDRAQTIEFSVSRTMPENIQIWLFRSSEHDLRARITRSFTSLFRAGDDLASVSKKANTQTVLFGVGKMLAFFQYSRIPDLELGKIRQMDAVALWPLNGRAVTWPPMKSIDVAGAQHLALTLNRFVTRPEMKRLF